MAQENRGKTFTVLMDKQNIYRLYPPQKAIIKKRLFGHVVYTKEKYTMIVPKDFKKENINPKNFKRLGYSNIKDCILFYSKTDNPIWNEPKKKHSPEQIRKNQEKIRQEMFEKR